MEMDAPLKREADVDDLLNAGSRTRREDGDGRRSRAVDNREVADTRELSDEDRIAMFSQTLFNDVLPDLPKLPGYHVCWLSTNHPSDTIPRRIRLGYELIRAEEVLGFEYASLKTGDYAGCIGINEMIAAKLPSRLYEAYMQEAHHNAPAREVENIVQTAESIGEEARRDGAEVLEGDGIQALRRAAPRRGIFED